MAALEVHTNKIEMLSDALEWFQVEQTPVDNNADLLKRGSQPPSNQHLNGYPRLERGAAWTTGCS